MVGKLIEARYSSRATYAESVLIARGSTARFRFRAITRVRLVVRDRNSSSQRPLGIVNSISKLCPFAKLLSFPPSPPLNFPFVPSGYSRGVGNRDLASFSRPKFSSAYTICPRTEVVERARRRNVTGKG